MGEFLNFDSWGLRLAPGARHCLCVDEKSQIRALDRSQPIPASRPEGAMTTEDTGTTSLFAASTS
jgi:hypothetical protein